MPFPPGVFACAAFDCLQVLLAVVLGLLLVGVARAEGLPALAPVPVLPLPWSGFRVFVWPYQTDARRDRELWARLHIGSFAIDQQDRAGLGRLAREQGLGCYVDHLAGKSLLHLTGADQQAVSRTAGLLVRPHSLFDPETQAELRRRVAAGLRESREAPALAYSLEDEPSLGNMAGPGDVDASPEALAWFRLWLATRYGTVQALNSQWGTAYGSFDEARPKGFEGVRGQLRPGRLAAANLGPWMDFRAAMDEGFATVLASLVTQVNQQAPGVPAGILGLQGPGPWGGYDYGLLSQALQWTEVYDTHGALEIMPSLWAGRGRGYMQTLFASGDARQDAWFGWRALAHGCQGLIVWPEGWFTDGQVAAAVQPLAEVFARLQGPAAARYLAAKPEPAAVGVYLSAESDRLSWALDATVHGSSWPRRSASLDDVNATAGLTRQAWGLLLADLGVAYDFVDAGQVRQGRVDLSAYRCIVLPRTLALADAEVRALQDFAAHGGLLLADGSCGVFDEHGRGRPAGALDALFGIAGSRADGYLNGAGLAEVDGERYARPFLERMPLLGAMPRARGAEGAALLEAGLLPAGGAEPLGISAGQPWGLRRQGQGGSLYLNLSLVEYPHPRRRLGPMGVLLREVVGQALFRAGVRPLVEALEGQEPALCKVLARREMRPDGGRMLLAVVKNPGLEPGAAELAGPLGRVSGVRGPAGRLTLRFGQDVHLADLDGRDLGTGGEFSVAFNPWEALLLEVRSPGATAPAQGSKAR